MKKRNINKQNKNINKIQVNLGKERKGNEKHKQDINESKT